MLVLCLLGCSTRIYSLKRPYYAEFGVYIFILGLYNDNFGWFTIQKAIFFIVGLYAVALFTLCLKRFTLAHVSLRPSLLPAHSFLIGQLTWVGGSNCADPKRLSVHGLTTFVHRTVRNILGGSRESSMTDSTETQDFVVHVLELWRCLKGTPIITTLKLQLQIR